jgi:hypothetical protein
VHTVKSHTAKPHPAKARNALARGVLFRARNGCTSTRKVSDRFFIVEDVAGDGGQNELNVGSNRITLAGANRQRAASNTGLA